LLLTDKNSRIDIVCYKVEKLAMKIDKMEIAEYIKVFSVTEIPILVLDRDEIIKDRNIHSINLLGKIENLKNIEHQFSFDVCVLDTTEILTYNPLRAAFYAKEYFTAETFFQIEENTYKNILIKSFWLNDFKLIIFIDQTDRLKSMEYYQKFTSLNTETEKLRTANKEYSSLKQRAESQAIRTILINRISSAIRDTLDINEIIKTAISEISTTLGVYRGLFASFDSDTKQFEIKHQWQVNNSSELQITSINSKDNFIQKMLLNNISVVSSSFDSLEMHTGSELRSRLIVPVLYNEKLLGMLMFFFSGTKRQWHREEVSLVEGIAAQLGTAVNQASLFRQLEEQKIELEKALLKLKQTQAQLVHSEKMASLGQLVAGVAHEINTPLGSINSNNDLLSKCVFKIKENNDIKKHVGLMLETLKINDEAINRINGIVKSLKNFARLDEAELKEADIKEGLKSTLMLLNHEIKNRIKIVEDYENILPIKCYPNILNQVFLNLLVNACQSIEGNGVITIKTMKINDTVVVNISDTGCGIAREHLSRIFDPGFTTKGVGVGTGLGLSICYQIIEKHKGKISVESEIGVGSTFQIEIPAI
jgi:signal transduction histidine kinase